MEENRRDFWAQKFSEYRSALNRYFRRQVSDPADAEDLAQEVYLRLLRVEQNATIQNPEAYLYTIAVNLLRERAALSSRRGLSVHLEDVDESLLGITASAEDEIDRIGRERDVEEAVNGLPPKLKAVIVMHYRHQRTHREMARDLGISTAATRKYVSQALQLCRRKLRN